MCPRRRSRIVRRRTLRATKQTVAPSPSANPSWRRSLVRMCSHRPWLKRCLSRCSIFGWPSELCVVTARSGNLCLISPKRPNIARELPYLFDCYLLAERRNAVWTTVPDGGNDRYHFRSVEPPAVEEGWALVSAPVPVACAAAKPRVETLAFAQ